MSASPYRKSMFRQNMMTIVGICLSFYFLYHLSFGHRGYVAMHHLQSVFVAESAMLEDLQADRLALETKVKMMRADTLDYDLLEERARYLIGYTRPDEVIVISQN